MSKSIVYNLVKHCLKKIYRFRRVWIELTEELQQIYIDDYGNMKFDEQSLENITGKTATSVLEGKNTLNTLNMST